MSTGSCENVAVAERRLGPGERETRRDPWYRDPIWRNPTWNAKAPASAASRDGGLNGDDGLEALPGGEAVKPIAS